jgi:hypothetical protein
MDQVFGWVDLLLGAGAIISAINSDAAPMHKLRFAVLAGWLRMRGESAVLNALYPWHQIRMPLGKPYVDLSPTEKLKIRWQLHHLKPYLLLWVVLGTALSILSESIAVSLVHAALIFAAYCKQPK